MKIPDRPNLAFFAYGLFRPGQLAFLRVKELVTRAVPGTIRGDLWLRDGLPVANRQGTGRLVGDILFFQAGTECQAYERIVGLEPSHQYAWGTTMAGRTDCNVLWGRSPTKGAVRLDESDWNGRADPLFVEALEVVEETLQSGGEFTWDLKPTFRLQMAYLLLWSAIERFTSLRYHLGDRAFEKIGQLATEPGFASAVRAIATEPRSVQRADRPLDRVRFDPQDPDQCVAYYYQLRSNIVHRGKGIPQDHDRVRRALMELLPAFRSTVKDAFAASRLEQ